MENSKGKSAATGLAHDGAAAHLENDGEAARLQVRVAGRDWLLERPADLESLWQAIASEKDTPPDFLEDERLPYWVELWPAGLALANWLQANSARLAGKRCLDLGCGLGLSALVAAAAGARVLGLDYEEEALRYARRNAVLNGLPAARRPLWVTMDWRFPALRRESFDFIWGGDIMYERRFVLPVLNFMEHALARNGLIWVAEPNRNVYAEFRAALFERGWQSRRVHSCRVDPVPAQAAGVNVSLWELGR